MTRKVRVYSTARFSCVVEIPSDILDNYNNTEGGDEAAATAASEEISKAFEQVIPQSYSEWKLEEVVDEDWEEVKDGE